MSLDCVSCKTAIKDGRNADYSIQCINCKAWTHQRCTLLRVKDLGAAKSTFSCCECSDTSNITSKDDRSLDGIAGNIRKILHQNQGLQTSMDSLRKEVVDQGRIMDKIKDEMQDLKKKFGDVEVSLNYQVGEIDELKKSTATKHETTELLRRVEEAERRSRRNNIEIHGIPAERDADTNKIVIQLAVFLGVPITTSDIDYSHFLRSRKVDMPSPIIVRFTSAIVKNSIMLAAKTKSTELTAEIFRPARKTRIYLNENLKRFMKDLLWKTKSALRPNVKFIWSSQGKIFIRKEESQPVYLIETEDDLKDIKRKIGM